MFYRTTLYNYLSLLLIPRLALALLYPTSPIADTVYDAGKLASVEWIDDGKTPYLQDMTIAKIDLYLDEDSFIATLVTGVDASSKLQTVMIPSDVSENTKYTLRFFCGDRLDENAHDIIYTAYFKIQTSESAINEASDNSSLPVGVLDRVTTASLNESDATDWFQPLLTVVLPNTTYVSTLSPTTKMSPSSTKKVDSTSHHVGSVPSGAQGGMDWECRFGFILCLVALGFVMAL